MPLAVQHAIARPHPSARACAPGSTRLSSLDAMRGLAVAAMIVVNNPGSWTDGYGFLAHSAWNGWTLADLVFPFFLLIVGVSIDLSLSRRLSRTEDGEAILPQVAVRALLLFVLGLLLNAFSWSWSLSTLRVFGVLQRIAACYLVGSALFLATGVLGRALTAIVLLVGYWVVMTFVPVPGIGAGVLTPEGNLAGYLDDRLFHGHLYREAFDPEGLLSTIPAVVTTLLGMLAGSWLRSAAHPRRKTLGLLLAGIVLAAAGAVADRWFPINKQLWTSSFVLLSGGFGLALLALCYELIDRRHHDAVAEPFVMLGTNALAVYLLSSVGARLMELCQVSAGVTGESLRMFLYEHLFASWAGALRGSLLFAVAYLLVWMVSAAALYRRRVFLRI